MNSLLNSDDQIRGLVTDGKFGLPVLGAWVYGSRAVSTDDVFGDIDLLLVLREDCEPRRISYLLPNDLPLSVNVIGPGSLGAHNARLNGGFFFTGKLLGPRYLIVGDSEECHCLLVNAFSHMIYPWLGYLLPNSSLFLSFDQLLALLFRLKIRINYCYLRHFAQWYASKGFFQFWEDTLAILRDSVASLDKMKYLRIEESEGATGLTFLMQEYHLTEAQKRVMVSYVISNFWQFNFYIRECKLEFLDLYFPRQVDAFGKTPEPSFADSMDFLMEKTGIRILS